MTTPSHEAGEFFLLLNNCMNKKILSAVFAGVLMFIASYAIAQMYIVDVDGSKYYTTQGTVAGVNVNRFTWVKVPYTEYVMQGNEPVLEYHYAIIRNDKILGIRGPYSKSTGLKDANGNFIMEEIAVMNTTNYQYPLIYLKNISDGTDWEQNLNWIYAVDRVVHENPGGIVMLEDYLP